MRGFRNTLTPRLAELERITRQRHGITIERRADHVDEAQSSSERALAGGNLDRYAAKSGTPARRSAEFRMAALGYVTGAMTTFIRSAWRQCHGRPFVSTARKPSIATLRSSGCRFANSSPVLHEGRGKRKITKTVMPKAANVNVLHYSFPT